MKHLLSIKYLVITVVAVLLSVATFSSQTLHNVPFCIHAAGCNAAMTPKGEVITRQYGYPVNYKQTETFLPANSDQSKPNYVGYAETTAELKSLDIASIVIDIIFWFALGAGLMRLLPRKNPTVTQ